MQILVTGATGFLGTALCRALVARGDAVTALGSRQAARIQHDDTVIRNRQPLPQCRAFLPGHGTEFSQTDPVGKGYDPGCGNAALIAPKRVPIVSTGILKNRTTAVVTTRAIKGPGMRRLTRGHSTITASADSAKPQATNRLMSSFFMIDHRTRSLL